MGINITDLKQFIYCPRVVYYTYVQPVPKATTYKMQYGRQQHTELINKEKRRGLKGYELIEGDRHFGYHVHSDSLGFQGKVDILIETNEADHKGQRFFPVECKDTDRGIYNNIKYQLVAYGMAIEEMTGTPVDKGYIYIIPENKAYSIELTSDLKSYVKKMVTMIHKIIDDEYFPDPRSQKRCRDCEYRRYCNDLDIPSQSKQKEENLKKMQDLFGT
jgi:CRISPR-associated exonuclease Cas4